MQDSDKVRATNSCLHYSVNASVHPTYLWMCKVTWMQDAVKVKINWSLLNSSILCSQKVPLHSFCMWFWISDCRLLQHNIEHPPKWCTYTDILMLHGWCHTKLLPSQHMFCVHHTTIHKFKTAKFWSLHYIVRATLCNHLSRRYVQCQRNTGFWWGENDKMLVCASSTLSIRPTWTICIVSTGCRILTC